MQLRHKWNGSFQRMLKWTDLPKIKQILTQFRFKMPHPWNMCFEDSSGGELKTEKQMNCCFDHFSWCFSETLFFRFGKHVHLVAWVVTVKFSCTTNNTVFSRFAQSLVSCFHGRQCCFQFFWTEHLKGTHYKCFPCNSLGLSCLSPPCVQKYVQDQKHEGSAAT